MAEAPQTRPNLASRAEVAHFLSGFAGVVAELQQLMSEETAHLAAGRIREGLGRAARKAELAASYVASLELARANAVALARFAPDEIAALKLAHAGFRVVVERNQAVIATARAVSEGLIKSVAEDVARQKRPRSYGSPPPARPAAAQPLVYSARL